MVNCIKPKIKTEFNRSWLNDTPKPVKTLTFADLIDVSDDECNALVLKDWEEFAVCEENVDTTYSVLEMKIVEQLTE